MAFKDITKEQIAKWKQTNGKLKEITITVPGLIDEEFKFIICKPHRGVLSAMTEASKDKDADKVTDLLIKNCVLGGDMDSINEDDKTSDVSVYLGILDELGKFMETKKVKSKFI